MMNHLATLLLVGASLLASRPLLAGPATFSQDGGSLIVARGGGTAPSRLLEVILATGEVREIGGPPSQGSLVGVGIDSESRLVAASSDTVWIRDASGGSWDPVARVPPGEVFTEGCMIPAAGHFVLAVRPDGTGEPGDPQFSPLHVFDTKKMALRQVYCRRVDWIHGLTATPSGQLFIGFQFDLWHGILVPDDDRFFLAAYRCAPLAATETNLGNSSGQGVYRVAAANGFLLVEVSRAGGSGWGSLVRLPRPSDLDAGRGEAETPNELEDRYAIYLRSLAGAAEVAGADKADSIIASPDGKTVLVLERNHITQFGAEGEGRTLEIRLPE